MKWMTSNPGSSKAVVKMISVSIQRLRLMIQIIDNLL
jgi:hypothetical protein